MGLGPDILAGVARRLAEHAGLQLPSWIVEARTRARIAALDTTPEAYVELIASGRGQDELRELVEAVRVGESSLFRHRPQIAALLDSVVPILRGRGRRSVRVWSAGCASGEEPYTLAIVLARALPDAQIAIHATDMSAEAIAFAEQASYPREALDDVPEEWQDAFVVDGDRIRVVPEVRRLVTFEQANLIDTPPAKACDVVWCRNVLIYFSPQARKRALERILGATVPGGFVFVGYSESLRDVEELESQRAGDAVYYMKRGNPIEREDTGRKTPLPMRASSSSPALAIPKRATTEPPIKKHEVLVLAGTPDPAAVTAQLGERLAIAGLEKLVIDLDPAELLGDELAPVLRRACAVARAAGIEVMLSTTRPGTRRWLSRHGLEESG